MTIEEKLKQVLVNNGMLEQDAQSVMEAVKSDPVNEEMAERWNDDLEGYPPQFLGALTVIAFDHALEWIDANCPLAWYRPMFVLSGETSP